MSYHKLILIASGGANLLQFPKTPENIANLVSALINSDEVGEFQNIHHLKDVTEDKLPMLQEGYFWYRNGPHWTVRKLRGAPEVVHDLDIYIRDGVFAGYNLSINKNLTDTFFQTGKKSGIKSERSYAGFTNDDFKNVATGFSDTIGHGVAQVDVIKGVDKKNKTIISNTNPRNYGPEQSTRSGGSDYGQSIRNHQLEAVARREKGAYREVNEFLETAGQVYCGLFVADIKHVIRIIPNLPIEYGAFKPRAIFKLDKEQGETGKSVWDKHKRNLQLMPMALVLDLTHSISVSKVQTIGYGYFLTKKTVLEFTYDESIEVGTQFFLNDDNEMRVIIGREKNGHTYQYRYYEFKRLIRMPVMVSLAQGSLCNYALHEMDTLDVNYKTRFHDIEKILNSLMEKYNSLVKYITANKDRIKRAFTLSTSTSANGDRIKGISTRKSDIRELAKSVLDHLKLAKKYNLAAKDKLISHANRRRCIIDECKAIPVLQIDGEEANLAFAEICHAIQRIDRDATEFISELIEEAEYHLSCIHATLLPPKTPVYPDLSIYVGSQWNTTSAVNLITDQMLGTGIQEGDVIMVSGFKYTVKKQAGTQPPTANNPKGIIFIAAPKLQGG